MMKLITILLFIIGIIMCIITEYKMIVSQSDKKEKFIKVNLIETLKNFFLSKSFNEYIITIIATVLGVTLAIVCTNYDTNENNRKKTIEFLNVLDTELLAKENLIDELILQFIDISSEQSMLLNDISISPILPLEVILTNDPYSSTISSYTYGALLDNRTAIDMCQNSIRRDSSSDEMKIHLSMISDDIKITRQIIKLELGYQNKEITEEELIVMANELYYNRALNVYEQIFNEQQK